MGIVFSDVICCRSQGNSGVGVKCYNAESDCAWVGCISELDGHEKECAYAEATCKYESIGCTEECNRKRMRQHEEKDTMAHLELSLETVKKLKEAMDTMTTITLSATR